MSRESTITIKTSVGDRQVMASVFGAWAVHRSWNENGWTISHAVFGYRIPNVYTEGVTKKQAASIARVLNEKFGTLPFDKLTKKATGKAIVDLIWKMRGES